MSRAQNLDTIAPDDPIPATSSPLPTIQPIKKHLKKKKKLKKKETKEIKVQDGDHCHIDINNKFEDKAYAIFGHTRHPFSSILVRPHVFDFQERDPDEKILVVLRPHWFTNVRWIVLTGIMLITPILLISVPLLNFFPPRYQLVSILFWYLVTLAFALEKFVSWYFNVFIITSCRVVDIDFHNLLSKKFSEAQLGMIQDVTYKVIGVSQTVLNYGDVFIQTAAEVPEIVFEKVKNPESVIKILQELREK